MSSRDLIKRGHVGCIENVMALDRLRVRTNVILCTNKLMQCTYLITQQEIRSVERGICPIATLYSRLFFMLAVQVDERRLHNRGDVVLL